jgi:hypothetical protein
MVNRPAENAVSAAPATPAGTSGVSSSAPVAISAVESRRANRAGGSRLRNGNALAAMPCMPAACSSSMRHLPRPEWQDVAAGHQAGR